MKEIEAKKSTDDLWKSFAAVGIAAAVGLGIGYAYQTGNNEELAQALSVANSKVGLLTSREKSLSTGLAEANNRASSTGTEWIKARDENLALTEKLKQTQEEAKLRERGLHEEVASLTDEIAKIKTRANALTKAIDPAVLKEIEGSMNVAASGPKSSNKDASIARNKELLKKFTRVSDDFTRPKVYRNDAFNRHNRECLRTDKDSCGLCALFRLTVDTDGRLGGLTFTRIQFLDGDDILEYKDLENFKESFPTRISGNDAIRCRLNWKCVKTFKGAFKGGDLNLDVDVQDDFTLKADDLQAIRETLELATISLNAR